MELHIQSLYISRVCCGASSAAIQAEIQWSGEDQDHWQHLHGCNRPQRGPRTRLRSGTPSFGVSGCVYVVISHFSSRIWTVNPFSAITFRHRKCIINNGGSGGARFCVSLRNTTGSTCTSAPWWNSPLRWWGSSTSSTSTPSTTSGCGLVRTVRAG